MVWVPAKEASQHMYADRQGCIQGQLNLSCINLGGWVPVETHTQNIQLVLYLFASVFEVDSIEGVLLWPLNHENNKLKSTISEMLVSEF